jgi:hypothetical protein
MHGILQFALCNQAWAFLFLSKKGSPIIAR